MKPNELIDEYEEIKISITIKEVNGDSELILLEGEPQDLEFLGRLIIAHAKNRDSQGCTSKLSPKGAGKAYFSKKSTKGLLIHVLPCEFEGKEDSHL